MGAEVAGPVITAESLAYNFTNEGGVCDTIRLLNNMTGLWVIQECRRAWASAGDVLSYQELTEMAEAAPPFAAIIDTDAPDFLAPGDMPARIREFCACHKQNLPEDKGTVVRVVLESLALKYRRTLEKLEQVLGYRLAPLHIVGGGSQNRLLNQFAANATQRPVVAGPAEATAIGNLLMQMLPLGHIASLAEGRDLVRRSFEVRMYEPRQAAAWDEAYERYLNLK
jgi:rhamnulokinase